MKRFAIIIFLVSLLIACNSNNDCATTKISKVDTNKTHGYNELANPNNLESFCISDYNSDNPEIENIKRPESTIIRTSLDTSLLFASWVSNSQAPHAEFQFSSKSFLVVDYDGDGEMPFILQDNSLKIYYNDFMQEGEIIELKVDTLKIKWKGFSKANRYIKWKN